MFFPTLITPLHTLRNTAPDGAELRAPQPRRLVLLFGKAKMETTLRRAEQSQARAALLLCKETKGCCMNGAKKLPCKFPFSSHFLSARCWQQRPGAAWKEREHRAELVQLHR